MRASISRNDILRAYPRAVADPDLMTAAVLDTAFDTVLHQLHRHSLFQECGLVFKGGTALRKFDIGHKGRFSFALDFNTTEDPGSVADIVSEALKDPPQGDMQLEMTERRGHHSIKISSDLLPDGPRLAKIDFSRRGLCLPVREARLRETPFHGAYPFDTAFAVPVIDLDENVAEKLSRWRTNPLVRDLYDLAALANRVSDHSRTAAMYVLKSYRHWVASPPNRRPATPAGELAGTLAAVTPATFALDDLVMPSAPSDPDKNKMIVQWLQHLAGFFDRLDVHVRTGPLHRFAANTDGSLDYQAQTELEKIGEQARARDLPAGDGLLQPSAPLLGM